MALSSWRRRATAGNAVAVTLFLVATLLVAVDAVERLGPSWDLSVDRHGTLSVDLLAAVDAVDARGTEVVVTAFATQKRSASSYDEDRLLGDVLRAIDLRSSQVVVRQRDLDRDRLEAEALGVDRYGTVVVAGAGDRVDIPPRDLFRTTGAGDDRQVSFVGEGALAAALRQVLSPRHRVVYALRGHGEKALFDRGIGDLRELARRLADQGWTARSLDLLEGGEPAVPDDASAVVVVGPSAPFAPTEAQALRHYLEGGGRLLWLSDPGGAAPSWLDELGVHFLTGVVRSDATYFPHDDRPHVHPGRHELLDALHADDLAVVLAHVGPVEVEPRQGVTAVPLLRTGRGGWVARPGSDGEPSERGEVSVAWALSLTPPATSAPARLVVVGDSDWVDDERMRDGPGNATLVVNAMRWLVEADEPLRSVGRPRSVRRVVLTEASLSAVRWGLVVVWPFVVGLLGVVVVSWRRR